MNLIWLLIFLSIFALFSWINLIINSKIINYFSNYMLYDTYNTWVDIKKLLNWYYWVTWCVRKVDVFDSNNKLINSFYETGYCYKQDSTYEV